MRNRDNIISLESWQNLDDQPRQLSLFCERGQNSRNYVFVDVAEFDEDKFLRLVVAHGVSVLVDLRPTPIFARPRFTHSFVTSYLHQYEVSYFECALKIQDHGGEFWGELSRVLERSALGLTVYLFDAEAYERGWCDHARKHIRQSGKLGVELNPRALTG